MLVQYSNDNTCRFRSFGKGLYYLDVSNPDIIPLMTESGNTNYSFLSTVNANMEYFDHVDIEGAYISCDLQHLLGCKSDQHIINALSKNLIINFLVLLDDVICAHAIYGPDTDMLKGVTAIRNPKHI